MFDDVPSALEKVGGQSGMFVLQFNLIDEVEPESEKSEPADSELWRFSVKKWMTKPSTPNFDFQAKYNAGIPMPYRTMVGTIEKTSKSGKMYYVHLHVRMTQEVEDVCLKCGRRLTNPVSRYFGVGPECGGHNYVNPFDSDEELKAAVGENNKRLAEITWEGWLPKSAIIDMSEVKA
jgi:hypothetical protein